MLRKAKGLNAERSIVRNFWEAGWAAVRVAGSGATKFPNPDVIAAKQGRKLAIECKTTKDTKKYLSKQDVVQLKTFASKFGAEPWIGIKFNTLDWYFISLDDLERTKNGFVVSIKLAKDKGLLFEELIR
ncbi:Holliday junction resolvase [Candidatus Woesearchaeota archaeon ex4484_78]|nr:MAG: Holliday junction resolvase [Candidatus Woesearchaeota archaeon ex4484_78]